MSTEQPKSVLGRPPKYKKEYDQQILDYFTKAELTETETETVASAGKAIEIEKTVCGVMPTFSGFAISIDTHRETLINWCRDNASFLDAYKRCKEIQEAWLVTNGLKGKVNTAFGIFTAKNVLGWRDKTEQIHSFDDIHFEDDNETQENKDE